MNALKFALPHQVENGRVHGQCGEQQQPRIIHRVPSQQLGLSEKVQNVAEQRIQKPAEEFDQKHNKNGAEDFERIFVHLRGMR